MTGRWSRVRDVQSTAGERSSPQGCGPGPAAGHDYFLILVAMLVAVTFAAYLPAVFAGYVWDDKELLYGNELIKAGDGLYKIWFSTEQWDYWPLTATMFWLEWRLWGDNPLPYHLGNIALHAAAAVLLWRVLRRLNLNEPGPYLAGVLFAVHPVTVASVAWIAERKNVLSMGLYLLSILAFLRFEEDRRRRWYALALLAAAAALLAKTSAVMLPFVLLLCTWWMRGRLTRSQVLRTVPFFVLSLAMGLVTVWFQHHHALGGSVGRPEGAASRIAASGWIIWFYLYKILAPVRLMMLYPRWDVDGGRAISFVPLAALIGCFAVLWICRKSWARGPLAALTYFVIALAPVLGFVDMAFMRYSLVADHLQYAAMPGVIALVAAGPGALAGRGWARWSGMVRYGAVAAACGVVAVLAVLTWRQAGIYKDEETMWSYQIRLNDRIWAAYNARGDVYCGQGDYELGIKEYTTAIELKPDYAEAYINRGNAHYNKGAYAQAFRDFTRAIELKPSNASAYNNRGYVYKAQGDYIQAIRDFTRAIELKPDHALAHANRADAYFFLKEYDKAWADVRTFRRLGGKPHPALVRALNEATGRTE